MLVKSALGALLVFKVCSESTMYFEKSALKGLSLVQYDVIGPTEASNANA